MRRPRRTRVFSATFVVVAWLALMGTVASADSSVVPEVVAAPDATTVGYATPVVVVFEGGSLKFTNLDLIRHTVTSDQLALDGWSPLFGGDGAAAGQTVAVSAIAQLPPGAYGFHCSIHPNIRGTLRVQPRQ